MFCRVAAVPYPYMDSSRYASHSAFCVTGVRCGRISGLSFGTVVPGHDVICAPGFIRTNGFALQGAFG
jgi:hypothetical protein